MKLRPIKKEPVVESVNSNDVYFDSCYGDL